MRRITSVVISCLLLIGLTLAGCVTEGDTEGDNMVTLTISSTIGGSVTIPGEGTFFYDTGKAVDLVAEAEEGYKFVNWTDNVGTVADVNAASTTIIMNDDYSLGADFVAISPVQYNLTISSTSGGSVTVPGEAMFTYDEGTLVDLVATPDAVHQFVNWTGDVGTIANINASATTITILSSYSIAANFEGKYTRMITGGVGHTVGVKSDGTVVAVGDNVYGQCNVGDWMDIIQADGGGEHTVGLKSDGTVVAVGDNTYGQCNVGNWTDIIQVVAGRQHTVGLKSDGTVVAVGDNTYGQRNVDGWTDIVQVAAGANSWHTAGRKSDGRVVAAGGNWGGQCNVEGWIGIIQVATGGHHTVALKADGTVVAVGRDNHGETNVGAWTDIVQIAGGCQLTIGLKSDGTVVTAGWNEYGQRNVGGWTNIIQVAAGMMHTIGLKSDGSVVTAGSNAYGQCNVGGWMLI
jgi:alpha-tubulin suppressor-like RCC1 family protein